jgi:hypothetical protein
MDQGHELVPGPGGASPGASADPPTGFAAEVRVRRLTVWERLLIRGGLIVLGGVLLLVLLPVVVLLLVLLTAYVAGALVVAAVRGGPKPAIPDLRRNVRVRGPTEG